MFGNNVFPANIYRKISTLDKPFWGLTKNRLDQLDADSHDYYVQFDYPSGSIVLTSDQVQQLLSGKKPAYDGDFKIVMSDLARFDV